MRSRGVRRKTDYLKANRKRNICKHVYGFEYYDKLGKYIKGKVHCSCPLCAAKSRINGYKASDLKKFEKMDYMVAEYLDGKEKVS